MNEVFFWLGDTVVLFAIIFFVFGCCIGSFLNVVIYRLPLEMSLIKPPSHCPKCDYHIPLRQIIPLFTWFWQRALSLSSKSLPRKFAVLAGKRLRWQQTLLRRWMWMPWSNKP